MQIMRKMATATGCSSGTSNFSVCKKCKSKVVTAIKCVNCSNVYHSSCAKLVPSVRHVDVENKILVCCDAVALSADEDDAFFDAVNAIAGQEKKIDVAIFNYIVKQKDILINELREQIRALRESDGAKKGDNNIDNQGAPALEKRDIKHQSLHKNVKKNKQNDSAKTSKSISLNVNNNTDMNSVNESTKPDERGQNDTSVVPKQDEWQTSKHRNSRKRQRVIVGESEENANGVATLQTVPKFIDLHVYRLHPSTTEADVIGYLKPMFKEVLCETLPSKHPLQYSSFKVSLYSYNFSKAMDSTIWPKGACIDKFFQWKKKNQPTQK